MEGFLIKIKKEITGSKKKKTVNNLGGLTS